MYLSLIVHNLEMPQLIFIKLEYGKVLNISVVIPFEPGGIPPASEVADEVNITGRGASFRQHNHFFSFFVLSDVNHKHGMTLLVAFSGRIDKNVSWLNVFQRPCRQFFCQCCCVGTSINLSHI